MAFLSVAFLKTCSEVFLNLDKGVKRNIKGIKNILL